MWEVLPVAYGVKVKVIEDGCRVCVMNEGEGSVGVFAQEGSRILTVVVAEWASSLLGFYESVPYGLGFGRKGLVCFEHGGAVQRDSRGIRTRCRGYRFVLEGG